MNRRQLSVIALGLVLILAGCAGLDGSTSEEALAEEPPQPYRWDADANGSITIENDYYTAVYRIEDRGEMRFYRETGYGDDRPVSLRSIRFRHENGTVVGADSMAVDETRSGVHVTFPAENGQFAYTGDMRARNFGSQAYVDGSYEVILPPDYRVDNIVLGTVRPGGYETELVDDRLHIHWDELGANSIVVRYYRQRDLYLLGGLVAVASTAALIGMGYVYRQIKALRRQREEMGLDVDIDDDDRRRPPPGMR